MVKLNQGKEESFQCPNERLAEVDPVQVGNRRRRLAHKMRMMNLNDKQKEDFLKKAKEVAKKAHSFFSLSAQVLSNS